MGVRGSSEGLGVNPSQESGPGVFRHQTSNELTFVAAANICQTTAPVGTRLHWSTYTMHT